MTNQLDLLDFERIPAPQRDAGTFAVITCRVCGARVMVTLSNEVMLCEGCKDKAAHLMNELERQIVTQEELQAAYWDRFAKVLRAASEADAARYGRVVEVEGTKQTPPTSAVVARRMKEAIERGDGLSAILIAREEMLAGIEQTRRELQRLNTAQGECSLALGKGGLHWAPPADVIARRKALKERGL